MHLIFLDESGDPGNPSAGSPSPLFVIGGFALHEKDWPFLKDEVSKIKRDAGLDPFTEVKWNHCMQPPGKPTPEGKRPNPLANLDRQQREKFAIDMLSVVRRITDCRVVACLIDKTKAYARPDVRNAPQIYSQGIILALERFQYFLLAKNARGVIIQDSREYQQDMRLREFYGSLLAKGSYWTTFPNVVEGVFLSPSKFTIGIQVADFCVGAIAKASNLSKSMNAMFFDVIKGRFTRPTKDQVQRGGLKHWP